MMMHTSSTTQHSGTGNKATNPPVLVRKSTIKCKKVDALLEDRKKLISAGFESTDPNNSAYLEIVQGKLYKLEDDLSAECSPVDA
jgi:hypothetical protein